MRQHGFVARANFAALELVKVVFDPLIMAPCLRCEHPCDAHKTGPYAPRRDAYVCHVAFCSCVIDWHAPTPRTGPILTRPVYSLDGQRVIRWE